MSSSLLHHFSTFSLLFHSSHQYCILPCAPSWSEVWRLHYPLAHPLLPTPVLSFLLYQILLVLHWFLMGLSSKKPRIRIKKWMVHMKVQSSLLHNTHILTHISLNVVLLETFYKMGYSGGMFIGMDEFLWFWFVFVLFLVFNTVWHIHRWYLVYVKGISPLAGCFTSQTYVYSHFSKCKQRR